MDNFFQFYTVEPDEKRATWVTEQCTGPKHTLCSIVPSGFSSYVRICHPARSYNALNKNDEKAWAALRGGWSTAETPTLIRWDDTAAANHRTPHRLMQWFEICSPAPREQGKAGIDPPLEGELTKGIIESLFEILIDHSGEDQDVLCGIWEGFGNWASYRTGAKFESFFGQQHYLLFSSTLSKVKNGCLAAHEYVSKQHSLETASLTPNAVWPSTRDWYLAVPYHRQSSYLGGPEDLVKRIMNTESLETYKALHGDDIWCDNISKASLETAPLG